MDPSKLKLSSYSSSLPAAGALSTAKMSFFTSGSSKKSKHEREKEAAEKKRREEEEAAAEAYKDFLEAFEGDGEEGPMAASGKVKGRGFVRAGGERYEGTRNVGAGMGGMFGEEEEEIAKPVRRGPPTGPSRERERELERERDRERKKEREREREREAAAAVAGKKASTMSSFLAELKRDSADRDRYTKRTAPASYERPTTMGSHDMGDPSTTNIHVGNLPTTITEQALGFFFCQYGAIGSLKIMWPREPGPSRNLGGFVAFMKRTDADLALRKADGADLMGNKLRCGWGKAVNLPPKCIIEVGTETVLQRAEKKRERKGVEARIETGRAGNVKAPTTLEVVLAIVTVIALDLIRQLAHVHDRAPEDARNILPREPATHLALDHTLVLAPTLAVDRHPEEDIVRIVARKVKEQGSRSEDAIKERERDNPSYAFLRDKSSKGYIYLRMLLDDRWRCATPDMWFDDDGANSTYSTDSAEESEDERMKDRRRGKLGKLGRQRFESMLRGITNTREKVARCMAFAIRHADACDEVVDILIKSLTIPSTPIPRKIARLHVISDILHNSSASIQNVWRFRSAFESRLQVVFDHLNLIYRSFPSRLKAEAFRMRIMGCVGEWDKWLAFTPGRIEEWEARLLTKGNGEIIQIVEGPDLSHEPTRDHSRGAAAHISAVPSVTAVKNNPIIGRLDGTVMEEDMDGAPMPVEGEVDGALVNQNLDGAAMDEDVDGAPMDDDIDGAPMEDDVDGAPMEEDVDGALMEEEVDGAPMQDGANMFE
ncbi:hypothetical protein BT69DRAFT_1293155 [Atractiella rhizophila]|nr:hypothetical protein BT69DRAFT_1293155 [Atractiella rhizophila]